MQFNKKITTYTFALLAMFILFNSCKKEYETIESIDDAKIQAYIKSHNLTMTKDPAGFYYQTLTQSTGDVMLNKDSVLYSLSLGSLGGTNYYTTAAYHNEGTYLGYVNPSGYRTALAGLKRGSKVRIILPSYLAYGKNGTAVVPSNEVVISEISTYTEKSQAALDQKIIKDYLTLKGLTALTRNDVHYIVSQSGTGAVVDIASQITVKYTGRILTGSVFDTSGDATITSSLGGLIKGWEVLLGMRAGTKVRIFIPSYLGYGLTAQSGIPSSSVLDFDIELVEVTN